LEIHLKLPEQSTNTAGYRVHWENISGSLGDLEITAQDAQSVVVVIPASKLSPGQYVLKLFRSNQDGEPGVNYYFNVEEAARTR
jgi:hypothetical protein